MKKRKVVKDLRSVISFQQGYYKNCTSCDLNCYRNLVVYGTGNPYAKLLIIGEAPGGQEDDKGIPFVGPAGKLLRQLYMNATGTAITDTSFITNVVCCRPPNNREPNLIEIVACKERLFDLIKIIDPNVVLLLGNIASKSIAKVFPISKYRGKKNVATLVNGVRRRTISFNTISAYHPSYLLRNKNDKRLYGDFKSDIGMAYNEAYGV